MTKKPLLAPALAPIVAGALALLVLSIGGPGEAQAQSACAPVPTLLCTFSQDISTGGLIDECIVGLPCDMETLIVVNEDPPTPPSVAGFTVNPAATLLTPAAFDFVGDVVDGDVVGAVTLQVRSDLGFLGACVADLTLGPNPLLDGTINTATTTGAPSDLFNPLTWPTQLDAERQFIETTQSLPPSSRWARDVAVFDLGIAVLPLNILWWNLGTGGWITAYFFGDPILEGGGVVPAPPLGAAFCTPFSVDTTVGRLRTCLTAGIHTTTAIIDPDIFVLVPNDEGTRFDDSTCGATHDVQVQNFQAGGSSPTINLPSGGSNPGTATRNVTLMIKNLSPHPEDIRATLEVSVLPAGCTVKNLDTGIVVSAAGGLLVDDTDSYSDTGPTQFKNLGFQMELSCSPIPVGEPLVMTACADHDADDGLCADDDDANPVDNIKIQTKTIQ